MIFLKIDSRTQLYPLRNLTRGVAAKIKDRLSFPNPKFLENDRRNFSNWGIPQEIKGYRIEGDTLVIPRGFSRQLAGILRGAGVQFQLDDRRRTLAPVDFTFKGDLRDFQTKAWVDCSCRDFGTLAAPTGSGKTVMALAIITSRRQPALIVVHRTELINQWIDRIGAFLGISAQEVGIIGGGKKKIGAKITVALVQSLYKCSSEVAPYIGHLVIDECHRCPSRTFTEAVTAFDSTFMLGLSATPYRRDGLTKLIFWHLGDLAHEVDKDALVDAGHVLEAEVIWRQTSFEPTYDPVEENSRMISELTQDPARNALIVSDVAQEARNGGGVCLVLTDRKAHCQTLAGMLAGLGVRAAVLTGDLKAREREQVVDDLNRGRVKVLVATGQLIGEGFDCKSLSTLFLATPIKFSGRLIQYLGRVLRPAPGKDKARVFDYLDINVGVLENAAWGRRQIYENQGR